MKKKITLLFSLLLALSGSLTPAPVLAADINAGCTNTITDPSGRTYTDVLSLSCLGPMIANIINLAFVFLGAVIVLFLFAGAIKFILSRGDPKAVESAQKTITYAIIGAVVIVLAVVAVRLIFQTLGLSGDIIGNFSLYYQP